MDTARSDCFARWAAPWTASGRPPANPRRNIAQLPRPGRWPARAHHPWSAAGHRPGTSWPDRSGWSPQSAPARRWFPPSGSGRHNPRRRFAGRPAPVWPDRARPDRSPGPVPTPAPRSRRLMQPAVRPAPRCQPSGTGRATASARRGSADQCQAPDCAGSPPVHWPHRPAGAPWQSPDRGRAGRLPAAQSPPRPR